MTLLKSISIVLIISPMLICKSISNVQSEVERVKSSITFDECLHKCAQNDDVTKKSQRNVMVGQSTNETPGMSERGEEYTGMSTSPVCHWEYKDIEYCNNNGECVTIRMRDRKVCSQPILIQT